MWTGHEPLSGVCFKVVDGSGAAVGPDDGCYYTDKAGEIVLTGIEPGTVVIAREVKTVEGFVLDGTPQDIKIEAGHVQQLTFWNKRAGTLVIQKKDKVSGAAIAGAEFQLTYASGGFVDNDNGHLSSNGIYTTNDKGEIRVSGVVGTIVAKETKPAPGYVIDQTTQTQTVTVNPMDTQTLTFLNEPLCSLTLTKLDSVSGKPVPGTEFTVKDGNGNILGRYVTGEDGTALVTGLVPGSTVVVVETKAPKGYVLDSTPRTITVKNGSGNGVTTGGTTGGGSGSSGGNDLTIENNPTTTLVIQKFIDGTDNTPLSGVEFLVTDQTGAVVGPNNGYYTTDKDGRIVIDGLTPGVTITARETKTIPGYVLDSTVREVSLYWGKTTTVELKNTPMGTLRVKKIDAITKKPIYGVTFNLYDLKNNLLGEYTTNDAGIIEFPKEIQAGKYLLKEVKAAPNYVLDDIPKTIEVKSGETTEIIVENQPVMGKIQIVKKSAEYNDVSKLPAGSFLEGAVFEIFNSRNEVVDRITTDKRGIANSKDLPAGEVFGIREITAPDFYLINPQLLYAEVKKPDDLIRFEILDANEEISVRVQKYGNIEAMPGDLIQYDFKHIGNASSVELEDFYFHERFLTDGLRLEKLKTGTWSEKLTYQVLYQTNLRDYRILADSLDSKVNHTLDCGREALGLAAGEYVTDIRFNFGTVQPGFHEEQKPTIYVTTLANLQSGYRIINRADVGGRTGDEWITAKDTWITVVWGQPKGKLPNTGI